MSTQTINWRTQMMRDIKGMMKPKFLTVSSIRQMAEKKRPGVSDASVFRWINEMEAAGFLKSVSDGLYANLLASPTPVPEAAAALIRRNAIVSLQSSLKEAGVDNNPSAIVTAIIPVEDFSVKNYPKPGEISTAFGRYRFYTMPAKLFSLNIGRDEDMFDQRKPYRLATPEKAILDWIYICNSPHISKSDTRRMAPPHMDLDLSEVSIPRMEKMADRMEIKHLLREWLDQKAEYDADENVQNNRNMGLGF